MTNHTSNPRSPGAESARGERRLTPRETADVVRMSESWLAKGRMRGDGPPYEKYGRTVRYPEGPLFQWMKSLRHLSTSER
jgi:hypothetical protein